jgi:hypothetical protein
MTESAAEAFAGPAATSSIVNALRLQRNTVTQHDYDARSVISANIELGLDVILTPIIHTGGRGVRR